MHTTLESPEDKALVEIQASLAKTSVSAKRRVVLMQPNNN